MPPPPAAALLVPPSSDAAAERLAMLRALPVSDEPLTEEEREAFDEGERFLRSGQRGRSSEEMLARIDQMRRDAGE